MRRVLPILVVAVVVFTVTACGSKASEVPVNTSVDTSQVKKVLFVIAHKDFRDEEFLEPKRILEDAGYKIEVASSDTTAAIGMLGAVVNPDFLITEVESTRYQALVIVGGSGCKNLWNNPKLLSLAGFFAQQEKILGAICLAPVVLANAGLLEGIEATCFPSASGELESAGADYKKEEVVVSGRIVTARGPEAAKKFGKEILILLEEDTD